MAHRVGHDCKPFPQAAAAVATHGRITLLLSRMAGFQHIPDASIQSEKNADNTVGACQPLLGRKESVVALPGSTRETVVPRPRPWESSGALNTGRVAIPSPGYLPT